MQYKADISLGNVLTLAFGIAAIAAAYWGFKATTKETFAEHSVRLNTHDKQIAEIKTLLPNLQGTLTALSTNQAHMSKGISKVENDLDWLVKREISKAEER